MLSRHPERAPAVITGFILAFFIASSGGETLGQSFHNLDHTAAPPSEPAPGGDVDAPGTNAVSTSRQQAIGIANQAVIAGSTTAPIDIHQSNSGDQTASTLAGTLDRDAGPEGSIAVERSQTALAFGNLAAIGGAGTASGNAAISVRQHNSGQQSATARISPSQSSSAPVDRTRVSISHTQHAMAAGNVTLIDPSGGNGGSITINQTNSGNQTANVASGDF